MSISEAQRSQFQQDFNVSRETIDRLEVLYTLLLKWNQRINLVAKSTIDDAWQRHVVDSAQIWQLANIQAQRWLDIGSGAGFPGLIIAAIAAEKTPEMHVTLVESDQRKCVFMQTAAREMGITVEIFAERIESLRPQNADIISARALAPLPNLLDFAEIHRNPNGICLFSKGANADSELTSTAASWHISVEKFPSMTDSQAVILRIGEINRV